MKNLKNIYYEKELLNIVDERFLEQEITDEIMKSTVVAVNLYYPDTVEKYLAYLEKVPKEMDIYIVSSNEIVLNIVKNFAAARGRVKLLRKENRGRDVSAFLVTLRETLMQYRYICFIHDKKTSYGYLREDIEFWVYNLWENMLKSKNYIKNILGILEKGEMGMLVPPSPIGSHLDSWYANAWYQDMGNTKKLAEKMKLNADIVDDKSPIALGTVFWANTAALRKLFDLGWSYGDFPDEPMPVDGTISHAVERVLPYVVQDAGLLVGIVMTNAYARKLLLKTQVIMEESFRALWDRFKIRNACQLIHYAEQEKAARDIFSKCSHVYLYGARDYGRRFLNLLKLWGYEPKGFVVSDGNKKESSIEGYPVYEWREINEKDKNGFIICTNYHLQDEIEHVLLAKGFDQYFKVILS